MVKDNIIEDTLRLIEGKKVKASKNEPKDDLKIFYDFHIFSNPFYLE